MAKKKQTCLIDFTGYGLKTVENGRICWSEPDILPTLQNEVILASLYVDDKEELPELDTNQSRFRKRTNETY